ncbi:MAG: hypothetical protein CM1200mP16_17170 [Nitrospina sp.]|nr:MAG: hypothetical protein CM1200mP16_17170 [Nitrospina sp.]
MYTANTMSSAFEAMGMSLPYSSTMANEDKEKELNTGLCAKTLMNMIKQNILPRDIMTEKHLKMPLQLLWPLVDPLMPSSFTRHCPLS